MDINPYLERMRKAESQVAELRKAETSLEKHVQCLEDLGDLGLAVKIVYGPMRNGQVCYTVDVMTNRGETFYIPYMAESFEQAVAIAASESLKRNWI